MKSSRVQRYSVALISRTHSRWLVAALSILVALGLGLAVAPAAEAQTTYLTNNLYSFTGTGGDGSTPLDYGHLVMDGSGNLYGTTANGGTSSDGTVFELVNVSGTYTEKVLYSFTGGADGAYPYAGLIMDTSGNLYGTTEYGGTNYGTVFELVNSSGTYSESVLYKFMGSGNGDGANPYGGLIMDTSGNLYGTTPNGGTSSNGTVFELVNVSGTYTEKVLYSFTGGADGAFPEAALLMDALGDLYGTTANGGTSSNGTVFELVNVSGTYTEKVLHSFTAGADGANPYAGLIMDTSGNLYGTTEYGGTNYGTVFELVNSSGTYSESVLYKFMGSGRGDGANPYYAGLIMDTSGNLYGTTETGGLNGLGTVFELVNSSGTYSEKVLYSFTGGADGAYPTAGLILDASDNLYGTTQRNGSGVGTVFELLPYTGAAYGTTTTLISTMNPASVGNPLALEVTVTSSAGRYATGTITLAVGSTVLSTQSLSSGQAGFNTSDATTINGIGTYTITAQYTPNVSYLTGSSSMLSQTVSEMGVAVTQGNNTFNGNQAVNGTVSATSFFGDGSGLTSVNALNLGGLSPSAFQPAGSYALLNLGNNFIGNQAITGNLGVSGSMTIGSSGTPITEHLSQTFNPALLLPALPIPCVNVPETLTGASDGDTVALGVPSTRMTGNVVYTAWVSAPNTVTIRACTYGPSAPNFGSGSIRVDIWKH